MLAIDIDDEQACGWRFDRGPANTLESTMATKPPRRDPST